MYIELAVLALFIFCYSLVAGGSNVQRHLDRSYSSLVACSWALWGLVGSMAISRAPDYGCLQI